MPHELARQLMLCMLHRLGSAHVHSHSMVLHRRPEPGTQHVPLQVHLCEWAHEFVVSHVGQGVHVCAWVYEWAHVCEHVHV
jgi:hypothetical protein